MANAKQFVSFSGFNWSEAEMEFHRAILKKFQLADWDDASDARVKVLVVAEPRKRTIKVLQCIARGVCVVDHSWLLKSVEAERLLPPEEHMSPLFPGAQISRTIQFEKEPRVFEERRLYLPSRTKMDRSVLEWLIIECGGTVVRSEEDADYDNLTEADILDAIENQVPPNDKLRNTA